RREFQAKVLGIDKQTDVAVIKIDARDLPTVKLGSSADIRVGQWVLAIGSPFGFENTVTAGVVSAKARSLPDNGYVPFIQTDVALNPGSSGGPLFNLNGEVIGINSQIYTTSGGYQGLSFAIPISVAERVEKQLVRGGHVQHARLGISVQEVNASLAKSFGLDQVKGALVSSVDKRGPAAKAGIEAGDIILSFDGKQITSSSELPPLVAEMQPGTRARLEVIHNGSRKEITVVLGELNNDKVASAAKSSGEDQGRLGLVARTLTPEEQRNLDVRVGVMVEDSTGAAAKAGIEPGDVILAVNGTPVQSADELRSIASKAGKSVALLV